VSPGRVLGAIDGETVPGTQLPGGSLDLSQPAASGEAT